MTDDERKKAERQLRDAIIEAAANVSLLDLRPPRVDPGEPRAFVEAGGAVYMIEVTQVRPPGWRKRGKP